MIGKPDTIAAVCNEIENGSLESARQILTQDYPFVPFTKASRKYTERQKTKVFLRDGFIDRYSGEKLVQNEARKSPDWMIARLQRGTDDAKISAGRSGHCISYFRICRTQP